jgi:hypothetical protein
LFVPGSPHIEGEPDKAVLICGQCGNIELACSDCHRTNVVTDAANRWVNGENVLVDCIEVNRIGIPG